MVVTIEGIVQRKENITTDVLYLSFKISEDFTFKAGQFIAFALTHNGSTKTKSYSILNPPSEKGKLDFCIKIIDGGFASEIFRKIQLGDKFVIKGPFGHFSFDEGTTNDHWFMGAGTGITPIYSIIKEHLPKVSKAKFHLLFGVKTTNDLLFHSEFLQLQRKYPHFTYTPCLSRETWEGKMGHIQEHLGVDLSNKTFYICGLAELVLETKQLLLERGVLKENIRFERYT